MKHLLSSTIIAVSLISCATAKYAESVYVFDYNNHDHPGFVVSPIATGMDYKPLADIRVEFTCGKLLSGADTLGLETYPNVYNMKLYRPTSRHILNSCIEAAKKFGADAIINFNLEYTSVGTTSFITATGIAVSLSGK